MSGLTLRVASSYYLCLVLITDLCLLLFGPASCAGYSITVPAHSISIVDDTKLKG